MNPRKLDKAFRHFAARRSLDLQTSSPSSGIPAMLRFYAEQRAESCGTEAHGDMLLFQWGTFDWGRGDRFELDITRQVVLPDDDDAIWQLHLTYRFHATNELTVLGSGDRWCESTTELVEFEAFVRGCAAFLAVADRMPESIEVHFDCTG